MSEPCASDRRDRRALATFATFMVALLLVPTAAAAQGSSNSVGEDIYRRGVNGDGVPVQASRDAGASVMGAAVACINCHRRSGLGFKEGRALVPPVAGRYLFHPSLDSPSGHDLPYVEGARTNHEPYTDATLARAIREGTDSEGRSLSYLMPRFALSDRDMGALITYLRQLDRRAVPGVTANQLHLATIVTPDADPIKRRGMLNVLEQFFEARNARQLAPTPPMLASGRTGYSKSMLMVPRQWSLHVWELTGPASTWQEQLQRHLARQPVFAVLSGLGGADWAPVHAFCERAELPCLFPNVEAPPTSADHDFYSLYFSKGVFLEAEIIGGDIVNGLAGSEHRSVRQVYRQGDVGEAGAQALEATLRKEGVPVSSRVLARGAGPADSLADAVGNLSKGEALVLWLRPGDLAALPATPQLPSGVYVSGLMGGLERSPLPPAWRTGARLSYPVDLPDARRVRVDFAFGWFRTRNIPIVAEQVQVDTYLACGLLAETVKHMVDNVVRDLLVERFEDTLEHRIVTGYYPRMSLAVGQRFASKGGSLVRFTEDRGTRLAAVHGWHVP